MNKGPYDSPPGFPEKGSHSLAIRDLYPPVRSISISFVILKEMGSRITPRRVRNIYISFVLLKEVGSRIALPPTSRIALHMTPPPDSENRAVHRGGVLFVPCS